MAGGGKNGEQRYSTGRAVAATTLGPYHNLAAGKQGKKARGAGRSLVESTAGGIGGRVVGALATRGNLGASTVAGGAGSYGGAYHAFRENNKKGRYKKQPASKFKKNYDSVSAFGVDHG